MVVRRVEGEPYDALAVAMDRVEQVLRDASPDWLTTNQVVRAMVDTGFGMQAVTVRQATEDLAGAGRCEVMNGPRRSRLFRIAT